MPRLPPGWMHQARGQLHLLLHPERPRWAVVNELGWQVAQLCDARHTIREMAAIIAERYRQDRGSVRRDVEIYVARLRQARMLEDARQRPSSRGDPGLAHLQLHLTGRCNLGCVHCSVTDGDRSTDELSTMQVFRLIDELVDTGAQSVALTGGEILLRADALRIAAYAADRLHTTMATNGTLITERSARALAGLGVPVQVSLDGATPATHDRIRGPGAFERTWRGIDLLLESGVGAQLAVCMTLMRWNLYQVPMLIDLAETRGVAGVRFLPLQRLGRAAQNWSELGVSAGDYGRVYGYLCRQAARSDREVVVQPTLLGFCPDAPESEPWCGLGRTLAVAPDGGIYPCAMLMRPEFRLGEVEDASLEEALRSARLRKLCAVAAARRDEIERCRTCAWRNFCQAGCPASVLAQKGTLWATDDLCEVRCRLYGDTIFGGAGQRLGRAAVW